MRSDPTNPPQPRDPHDAATSETVDASPAARPFGRARRRSLPLLTVGTLVAWDLLVYGAAPGAGLAVFALGVVALLWFTARRARRRRAPGIALAASVVLAVHTAIDSGPLDRGLLVLSVLTLAIALGAGSRGSTTRWSAAWLQGLTLGWFAWLLDLDRKARCVSRRPGWEWRERPRRDVAAWTLPLLPLAVFWILFAIANPVFADWSARLGGDLRLIFGEIDAVRVATWLVVVLAAGMLLRPRAWLPRRRTTARTPGARAVASALVDPAADVVAVARSVWNRPTVVRNTLLACNALFAVQTVLDGIYLWAGVALPNGMTYAEYAHRGAYPLVLTALLAAGFVLAVFRTDAGSAGVTLARRLVVLWIAQNVLLTASAIWRLVLYIDVYHLTRLRVAAGIWMLLVAIGLVLVGVRIVARRDGAWLVERNLQALLVVLFLTALAPIDAWIAHWNVDHSRELSLGAVPLDLDYVAGLGAAAIPALERFRSRAPRGPAAEAEVRLDGLRRRLARRLEDPRGFTWVAARTRAAGAEEDF